MFKDLPATFPEKDQYKGRAAFGSMAVHIVFVSVVVLIPVLFPQHIERFELLTFVAPLPPPPAPPPPPAEAVAEAAPAVIQKVEIAPEAVIMPTVIPREIARIVDDPAAASAGVVGGVAGGMPGGLVGGVLGGLLARNEPAAMPAPAPPPPPPQAPLITGPVRVGGDIREPRITRLVPPVYPMLAFKARVEGTVLLEATIREDGAVDEIKVSSGHPLLIEAAIDCVKQWRYEPTVLNGTPIAVILTAKVHFQLRAATTER